MNFWKFQTIAAGLLGSLALSDLAFSQADIQFWGDTYINWQMTKKHRLESGVYDIFGGVQDEIDSSQINVLNFEGVATGARFPFVLKRFTLTMPLFVDRVLVQAGIDAVTLANNHTMDYGRPGLHDTIATLERGKIKYVGAGFNAVEANVPLTLVTHDTTICVLNYSRTLPEEHWARGNNAGSANLSFANTAGKIMDCKRTHDLVFVVYHWGMESSKKAKKYQIKLARLSIDSGADAVVGHHPHVLQQVEIYKNKPILYSIGNFAFASNPNNSSQQGLGAKFYFENKQIKKLELIPLIVGFRAVKGRPKLFEKDAESSYLDGFVKDEICAGEGDNARRICEFNLEEDES